MTRVGSQRHRKKSTNKLIKEPESQLLYPTEKIRHMTNQNNTHVKIIIILTTITRFPIINALAQEPKGQLQRQNTKARENASSNSP
jgi:hypothetical protein